MSLDYGFPERLDVAVINDASVSEESLDASLNPGEELFGEGEWPSLRGRAMATLPHRRVPLLD